VGEGRCEFQSKAVPVTGVQTFSEALVGASKVLVLDNQPGELIWLTRFSALPYEKDEKVASPRFLGESSLKFARPSRHKQLLEAEWPPFELVFGAAGGAPSTQLPPGFGIPMYSNEPLLFQAAVVNFDAYQKATKVHLKGQLDYVRQRGLKVPIKPLRVSALMGLQPLDPRAPLYGKWTLGGPLCPVLASPGGGEITDRFGQPFRSYWTVRPGKNLRTHSSEVTYALDLDEDTLLHQATAVVDPCVKAVRLVDLSDSKVVLALNALSRARDGTLAEFESFSSLEGTPLRAGHRYILEFDCVPGRRGDLQASGRLYVYLEDTDFRMPSDD
jgi:hypothetical protein